MPINDNGRLSILLLADDCNPEWPSLPIVAYKYALAISKLANVVVATHVRNRENIENIAPEGVKFVYLDNEWVASPLYKIATRLRGGTEVSWSINMIMQYLPYLAFEREAWKHFRPELDGRKFDIVHRISPMSPTLPSYIARKVTCPFVLGPLNGNLPWPKTFGNEQKRERERLRFVRSAAINLPYARSTYRRADLVLAGFEHTIAEVEKFAPNKTVNFPEIGYDPEIFHSDRARPAFGGLGPFRFLFVGRLVPYKLAEVAVRAFVAHTELRNHHLHIVGDGPEMGRLREIVTTENLDGVVHFEGRLSQKQVAEIMRDCDGFVFPSIRELGAGVVIEAMSCGMTSIVADYGAPGHLVRNDRGIALPVRSLNEYLDGFREALLKCVQEPQRAGELARAGQIYAEAVYPWQCKAEETIAYYHDLLAGNPLVDRGSYN